MMGKVSNRKLNRYRFNFKTDRIDAGIPEKESPDRSLAILIYEALNR
jgi:hypothetical protein